MEKNDIMVKNSKIEGNGVFANRDFKKGEVVIKWNTDFVLPDEKIKQLPHDELKYVVPYKGKFILQQAPARYVNHSCDPNTHVVDECSDVAIRDIKKGEEITSDYSASFEDDECMECNCGSSNCRKIIKNY